MIESRKTDFISFFNRVTRDNAEGAVEISVNINGMALTDAEVKALKILEEKTAEEADKVLNK